MYQVRFNPDATPDNISEIVKKLKTDNRFDVKADGGNVVVQVKTSNTDIRSVFGVCSGMAGFEGVSNLQ